MMDEHESKSCPWRVASCMFCNKEFSAGLIEVSEDFLMILIRKYFEKYVSYLYLILIRLNKYQIIMGSFL